MLRLSLSFGFIVMILGGFGFASTSRAGLDGPFMHELNSTVTFDKISFLIALGYGIALFASGMFSVTPRRGIVMQMILGLTAVITIATAYDAYTVITAERFELGETTLRAFIFFCALLYGLLMWRIARREFKAAQPTVRL
ncbi:MAG: hypothetical protein JNL32_01535 [Candidatus Kapabacteria bacterium]|nr:hypothetical protein [Candidatus Kapabacteria bacterium]